MNSGINLRFDDDGQASDVRLTVAEYLTGLNASLKNSKARIVGEICNLKLYEGRSYMYFSVKDKDVPASLNCFMWKKSYALSGIDIEDGMEVVIYGYPKVYEPNGSLSFQTETIELVGEGALKKAYDKLKLKLEKEGIFSQEKKREIPAYPHRIGIVTSKDGAVLSDFTSNIGKFGYDVSFVNSRVEGQIAIRDLINSVRTLRNKNLDVLVIMRGGGSLESFAAFNNEALVREIAHFPVPVIAGIGHDKDISLVSLAADKMVSTPTAVAEMLNKSWEQGLAKVLLSEKVLFNNYLNALRDTQHTLQQSSSAIRDGFGIIFQQFNDMRSSFRNSITRTGYRIREIRSMLARELKRMSELYNGRLADVNSYIGNEWAESVAQYMYASIARIKDHIEARGREIALRDPERLLKSGYSIVRYNGKIINSSKSVKPGGLIAIKTSDGEIESEVKKIL